MEYVLSRITSAKILIFQENGMMMADEKYGLRHSVEYWVNFHPYCLCLLHCHRTTDGFGFRPKCFAFLVFAFQNISLMMVEERYGTDWEDWVIFDQQCFQIVTWSRQWEGALPEFKMMKLGTSNLDIAGQVMECKWIWYRHEGIGVFGDFWSTIPHCLISSVNGFYTMHMGDHFSHVEFISFPGHQLSWISWTAFLLGVLAHKNDHAWYLWDYREVLFFGAVSWINQNDNIKQFLSCR